MENKITAVEWLINEIDMQYPDINVKWKEWMVEKAKEMEKEQIIDAHDAAYIAMNLAFRGFDRSVEYYEATYGK